MDRPFKERLSPGPKGIPYSGTGRYVIPSTNLDRLDKMEKTSAIAINCRTTEDWCAAQSPHSKLPPKILHRSFQALLPRNPRLPLQDTFRYCDIRLANLRIILRQRLVNNLALAARQVNDFTSEPLHRDLFRIPNVHRRHVIRHHQLVNPFDEIGDIADAARLVALAEHCDIFVPQRLRHECRDRTAIINAHPLPICIKDPGNSRVELMIAMVGHRHRFSETLRLVVDTAWPNRIDVSPIRFGLGMNERIAVDLRGRSKEESSILFLSEAKRLVSSEGADLERLNGELQIVDGTRRRGEMKDEIDLPFYEKVVRDIVVNELEAGISREMGDVIGAARDQVVNTDDRVLFGNKPIAEMRAEKTGAAGDNGNRHSQVKESKQTFSR